MNSLLSRSGQLKNPFFYTMGMAIAGSLLLSLAMFFYASNAINLDGICYLTAAEAIRHTGLGYAMSLCGQAKWPFYSWLIAHFSHVSHLSYLHAAYVLNGFFSLGSVIFFVLIVKELEGNLRTQLLAVLVILASHHFNELRDYIIRDHGFWAAYLGSIFFLLRYLRNDQWLDAFLFGTSLVVSTLFRLEGSIFLILLPFLMWVYPGIPNFWLRAKHYIYLNIPFFIILCGLIIVAILHPKEINIYYSRLFEVFAQFQHGIQVVLTRYSAVESILSHQILHFSSTKEAGLVLSLLLVNWFIVQVFNNLTWIYSILILYGIKKKALTFSRAGKWVVMSYLLINAGITFIFLAENYFLSKRYLLALSLTLMLCVPFALELLLKKLTQFYYQCALVIVVFLILVTSFSSITRTAHSKAYLYQAGNWLKSNVSQNANLYTNDYGLMYYSQHFGEKIFQLAGRYKNIKSISQGNWQQFDYVAIRTLKKTENKINCLLQEIPFLPIQTYQNRRGDKVIIYQIKR